MPIHIPKPCTEKWSDMSPSERGRHCAICEKEVVDFTNWETADIIAYIQNANQRICGKLPNSTIRKTWFRKQVPYKGLAASLILSSVIGLKSTEAASIINNESTIQVSYLTQGDSIKISGMVTNSENRPLSDALIQIDQEYVSHTDKNGNFAFTTTKGKQKDLSLIFSCLSYEDKTLRIKLKNKNVAPLKVILEHRFVSIGEIVVKRPNVWQRLIRSISKK